MTKSMPIRGWRSYCQRNQDRPRGPGATATIMDRSLTTTSSVCPLTSSQIHKSIASIYCLAPMMSASTRPCINKASKRLVRLPTSSLAAIWNCWQRWDRNVSIGRLGSTIRTWRKRLVSIMTSLPTSAPSLPPGWNLAGLQLLIWGNSLRISNLIPTTFSRLLWHLSILSHFKQMLSRERRCRVYSSRTKLALLSDPLLNDCYY